MTLNAQSPTRAGSTAPGTSLYHGLAGVVLALHEAGQHFGDDRYRQAAARGADDLSALVDGLENCSLYFGPLRACRDSRWQAARERTAVRSARPACARRHPPAAVRIWEI